MPQFIDRDGVQRLVDERDAIVAEVLAAAEYEWARLCRRDPPAPEGLERREGP